MTGKSKKVCQKEVKIICLGDVFEITMTHFFSNQTHTATYSQHIGMYVPITTKQPLSQIATRNDVFEVKRL